MAGQVHILPVDDTTPHARRPGCPCRPDPVDVHPHGKPTATLWVHHAFDGRPAFEDSDAAGAAWGT